MQIVEYSSKYFHQWNNFIQHATNGTIFHRLDFLQYHGDKFQHCENHLLFMKGSQLAAVMPLALICTCDKRIAQSPIGASYGGIVFSEPPSYAESREFISLFLDYLRTKGVDEIRITLPIQVVHRSYSETFMFAMLEAGFGIVNADISSVVDLSAENVTMELFSPRVRRMMKKATKEGIILKCNQPVAPFWQVLNKTFSKHGSSPTHSYDEWNWLSHRFPDNIWCDVAYLGDLPVAGIGHIKLNKFTDSSFYICQDPEYQSTQALSLLIAEMLQRAKTAGIKFFDFGTSSVDMVARSNIFQFKEGFGAVGYFRYTMQKLLPK